MWVLAYFTEEGQPVTGLSPTVLIKDVDTGADVIAGASMDDIGDGFYRYDFSAYNPTRNYAVTCDSITLSGVDRYTYAASGEYGEVLDSIESTVGLVDIRTTLLRKIQTNRLELFDGNTNNWILYDDDAVTPLLTFSVSDKNDDIIVQCPNSPSKRSGAAGVSGTLSPDIYMRKSVYDPDDDGCVSCAENVSDGIYTSTASGIKYAVDNAHDPCMICTTLVNESTQGDQLVLKYDAATDRIIYGLPGVSGSVSGTISHKYLLDLDSDDHLQYVPRDGSRGFTNTVSGVWPTESYHLTTKQYVDFAIGGLDWQESVLSMTTEYGDAVASGTNRYIAPSTSGVWTENNVYQWDEDSMSWTEFVSNEGFAAWIEDTDYVYIYNGTEWIKFSSITPHNNLAGIQGGSSNNYYHLTQSEYNTLTFADASLDDASLLHIHDSRYYTETEIDVISGSLQYNIDNHTHDHTAITDWDEAVLDTVGPNIVGAGIVTVTYDDGSDLITVSGSDTSITDHGLLSGLGDNDHTQYVNAVGGPPLTLAAQTITFNYDTNDFQLSGNNLQIKDSGIDHGSLSGLSDNDHPQYILHLHPVGTNNLVGGPNAGASIAAGASNNIVLGKDAASNLATADNNVMIGVESGKSATTADSNVMVGYQSGEFHTSGDDNVYIGNSAGASAGSATGQGIGNVFIGSQVATAITTADQNVSIGYIAGQSLTTGDGNVIVGGSAGNSITTGQGNTIIGKAAGLSTTGSKNVFIGYESGLNETGSNKLYIDNSSTTTPLIYGDFSSDLLRFNADVEIRNGKELRFYDVDNSNYVGFEAPPLTSNQIWVLPPTDGLSGQQLTTDGLGNLTWSAASVSDHELLTNLYGGSANNHYHLTSNQHMYLTNVSGILDASNQHIHDDRYYTELEIQQLIGINKSGSESVINGSTGTSVSFSTAFPNDDYALFVSLENITDSPASEYAINIDGKTASGFSVHYSGDIDSDNYILNWYATTSGIHGGNYISELADDSSPELSNDLDLNSYGINLDTTPSGQVVSTQIIGYSGEISTMQIDLNDTGLNGIGVPLHMKSNGHWERCTAASGTTRMPCAALSIEQGTGSKKILWKGIMRKGSWSWTPGNIIYVSTVDGALTSTAPINAGAWVQPIGVAIASDTIRFDTGFNPGVINS